jgi:hypothetical protein
LGRVASYRWSCTLRSTFGGRYPAPCLGHTHRPSGVWEDGRFAGNSGAWCPAFRDPLCIEPVFPRRPLLVLTSEDGDLQGGLRWWDGADLSE